MVTIKEKRRKFFTIAILVFFFGGIVHVPLHELGHLLPLLAFGVGAQVHFNWFPILLAVPLLILSIIQTAISYILGIETVGFPLAYVTFDAGPLTDWQLGIVFFSGFLSHVISIFLFTIIGLKSKTFAPIMAGLVVSGAVMIVGSAHDFTLALTLLFGMVGNDASLLANILVIVLAIMFTVVAMFFKGDIMETQSLKRCDRIELFGLKTLILGTKKRKGR